MRHILILLATLAASPVAANADDGFSPAVTFPAARATLADRKIDILELVPGMNSEETRDGLLELHPSASLVETMTFFAGSARGVAVQTAEFLDEMSAGTDADRIAASFTGLASGNQVFAIERIVRYPEVLSAPTVDAIAEALVAKYGPTSYNSRDFRDKPTAELIWVFAGGEQIPCMGFGGYGTGENCPTGWTLLEYKPQQLAALATETSTFEYAIIAKIETHQVDRSKSVGLTVTVSDLLRRKQAAAADMQALMIEIERRHAEASSPAAAPSL